MNKRKNSNDTTPTNIMASENPLLKQTYSHSTSYEKHINTTSNTNNFEREQHDSRNSSPSATVNSNRSPSPTSGYGSSNAHGEGVLRDSTSPPSAYVPQHDYLNVNIYFSKNLIFLQLFRLESHHHHHQPIQMPLIDVHHHLDKMNEHHQL
jgi:hypothetical protein